MKKLCFLLLIFLSAVLVFAGGQSSTQAGPAASSYVRDPNLNPPGTFPLNKNTVTLKIGVEQSALVEDWSTNWQTQQVEKNGNYNLIFDVYPAGELNQKVELMVMAGGADLPDVVFGSPSIGVLTKYGQAGMVIPTNVYWENSAYYSNLNKGGFPIDILKYITSYDGNIYGLFYILGAINNEYSAGWMMIYEPWLQKLGLNMPVTTDDFINVMRAFRDRDPNGNGLKDEIPITGDKNTMLVNFMRAMMNPFIYTQANFWTINNGKIDVSFNKPGWRDGLRYAKSLYDEGLVSPLAFTQERPQLVATVSPNPTPVGVFAAISGSMLGINDPKRQEYIILPPLQGPTGLRQAPWSPTLPVINMYITKNCKTPESAFVMGDYMYSEEMSVGTRWGEKGVDWKVPAPGTKSVFDAIGFPATIEPVLVWGTLQNKMWAQVGPAMTPEKWANGIVATPTDHTVALGRSIAPAIQYKNPNPIVGLIYNEQEQAAIDEYQSTILNYVNECYERFITGDLSIDRDWNNYVADFDKMGLNDIITATQSAWDRMNK